MGRGTICPRGYTVMLTDIIFEDDRWQQAGLQDLAETAAIAALGHVNLVPTSFVISVLACNDARIAELNADFRDKPSATNVLSWPAQTLAAEIDGAAPNAPQAVCRGSCSLCSLIR